MKPNKFYGFTFEEFRKAKEFNDKNYSDQLYEYLTSRLKFGKNLRHIVGEELEKLQDSYPFLKKYLYVLKGKDPSGNDLFVWIGKKAGKGYSIGTPKEGKEYKYNPFVDFYYWIKENHPEAHKYRVARMLNDPRSVLTEPEEESIKKEFGEDFFNANRKTNK